MIWFDFAFVAEIALPYRVEPLLYQGNK